MNHLMERVHIEPANEYEYDTNQAVDQWWKEFFPGEAWQSKLPNVIETKQGILLFGEFEQLAPDRLELRPLTMVLPQRKPGNTKVAQSGNKFSPQDVWIVNSLEGADIQFREAFDFAGGDAPPVLRGQLRGKIEIQRHDLAKSDQAAMSLVTSNVFIDHARVTTEDAVTIQVGGSTIRGRDLTIRLRSDLLDSAEADEAPWGSLDMMELIYVDVIDIELPRGGLWADSGAQPLGSNNQTSELPARLEIRCGAPFRFDFSKSQASMLGGVHMLHYLGNLPPDQFWAQEIQLGLKPRAAVAVNVERPLLVGSLAVHRIDARGIDPVGEIVGEKWVELAAPNIDASLQAKRLVVDFDAGEIELYGRLEHAEAVQSIAKIDYQRHLMRAPWIEYRSPKGQALIPSRQSQVTPIGWFTATGPGELHVPLESGPAQIRWHESLKVVPDADNHGHWLELVGKALVDSAHYGFLASDRLQVWLSPSQTPDGQFKPVNNPSASKAISSATSRFRPDRFLANGNVNLTAHEVSLLVDELKAWMLYAPTPEKSQTSIQPSTLTLNSPSSAREPVWLTPPQSNAVGSGPSQIGQLAGSHTPPTDKSESRLTIQGQSMQTRIITSAENSWIDALTVSGPLTVKHDDKNAQATPWQLDGNTLYLESDTVGHVNLQIVGEPATVTVGDGTLKGTTIRYDQKNNLLWMDQPGEFVVPMQTLNAAEKSAINWIRPPHCKWNGRMLMEGDSGVVRIVGNIEFDGILSPEPDRYWYVQGYAQQLDIYLTSGIKFQRPSNNVGNLALTGTTEAQIERIVFSDNVDIRAAQTNGHGDRQSVERMLVPTLTYFVLQDKLIAQGPGSIESKHIDTTRQRNVDTRRSLPEKTLAIQGAHLMFRDHMVGFLKRDQVVFEGNVELAVGPLASWEHSIDLNTLRHLNPDQMLITCDQLTAYDTQTTTQSLENSGPLAAQLERSTLFARSWEAMAIGNVTFEGDTENGNFSGTAYRVTYSQNKNRLLIEGDGRTPSKIYRTLPDGRIETADILTAAINTHTREVENFRVIQARIESPTPRNSANPFPDSSEIPLGIGASAQGSAVNPRSGVSDWFHPK